MKALIRRAREEGPRRPPAASGGYGEAQRPAGLGASAASSSVLAAPLQQPLPTVAALPVLTDETRVGGLPSVHLLEEWCPADLEEELLSRLRAASDAGHFVQLRGKRTARFGGDVGPPFAPEPLPLFLEQLSRAVDAVGAFPAGASANHVLVNHYRPGEGIMPHTDGPAYHPVAVILSLGSAAVFDFWRDHADAAGRGPPALSLLLPPRSLLIFSDEAYGGHLHGIADRRFDALMGAGAARVANWRDAERKRWASQEGGWFSKQVEDPESEAPSLRRAERYSLTIRHVPLTAAPAGATTADAPAPLQET
eukprot:TRINITY_DN9570_c0_g4_i1.p1 TRINITY_DN9570_c0_g4~~TRINITY_DN9570_c0_g4_i1.p1  ORF type:complete len:309 (+),score=64.89 TRINITY_DN9570_c0_g4_i1:151-1077(+)